MEKKVEKIERNLAAHDQNLESLKARVQTLEETSYNGNFVCKVIDIHHRRLLSANDIDEPVVLHDNDEFSIEGVVTRSIRLHKPSHFLIE